MFTDSLLGRCLQAWRSLPDNQSVHQAWVSNLHHVSYHPVQSLQELLDVFARWITAITWQSSQGFLDIQSRILGHARVVASSSCASEIPGNMNKTFPVCKLTRRNLATGDTIASLLLCWSNSSGVQYSSRESVKKQSRTNSSTHEHHLLVVVYLMHYD